MKRIALGNLVIGVAAASGVFGACRWLGAFGEAIGKLALAAATRMGYEELNHKGGS